MASKVPTLALVAVVWLDATYVHDEMPHDELKPTPAVTVGKVVNMCATHITIASEVFNDGDYRQVMAIPRGMVQRIVPLKTIRLPEFA